MHVTVEISTFKHILFHLTKICTHHKLNPTTPVYFHLNNNTFCILHTGKKNPKNRGGNVGVPADSESFGASGWNLGKVEVCLKCKEKGIYAVEV